MVLTLSAASSALIGCPAPARVGTDTCLACHDGRAASDKTEFRAGVHDFIDCETCHGPGALHVRNVGAGSGFILNPARLPFPASIDVCAECHAEETAGFLATDHAGASISCHVCHDVHKRGAMLFSSPNRTLLQHVGYDRLCSECHQVQTEQYELSAHFALPELTCAVCHNMHVPRTFTAPAETNALCLQCHQSRALGFTSVEIVDAHTGPFHPVDPAGSGSSRCTQCHLPPVAAALPEGPSDHTLATVPPAVTVDAIENNVAFIPANSCAGVMGCHDSAVPSSGMPHDVTSVAENAMLQALYEMIGDVPQTQ